MTATKYIRVEDAKLCVPCAAIIDGDACGCGNPSLILVRSLIDVQALRAEIQLSRKEKYEHPER